MARPSKYPPELIERGVRLALESKRPIAHVAADRNCGLFLEAIGIRPKLLAHRLSDK
jgi:hypothetical protein